MLAGMCCLKTGRCSSPMSISWCPEESKALAGVRSHKWNQPSALTATTRFWWRQRQGREGRGGTLGHGPITRTQVRAEPFNSQPSPILTQGSITVRPGVTPRSLGPSKFLPFLYYTRLQPQRRSAAKEEGGSGAVEGQQCTPTSVRQGGAGFSVPPSMDTPGRVTCAGSGH